MKTDETIWNPHPSPREPPPFKLERNYGDYKNYLENNENNESLTKYFKLFKNRYKVSRLKIKAKLLLPHLQ